MKEFNVELFADYFHINIEDVSIDRMLLENLNWTWTADNHRTMLAEKLGNRIVIVGTFTNYDVPVKIQFHTSEPPIDSTSWSQISECSLHTFSQNIYIMGNEYLPEATIYDVSAEFIRIRAYYFGVENEEGDYYKLEIWPTQGLSPLKVIKQREYVS